MTAQHVLSAATKGSTSFIVVALVSLAAALFGTCRMLMRELSQLVVVSRWSAAVAGIFVRVPAIRSKVFNIKRENRTKLHGCFLVCFLVIFGARGIHAQSSCETKASKRFCRLRSPATCGGTYHEMVESEGADNPMNGVDMGDRTEPTMIDQDNDGDFDMWVGDKDGLLNYFENTGNKTNPVFMPRIGVDNPMNGVDVGANAAPTMIDQDNDGDFDMWVGNREGNLHYFENT